MIRKMKVLLDTDPGSDIDDALAMAYLLGEPECELLGVTTVTGEPEQRARLISAICRATKREVPIHAGLETPLAIEQKQPKAPQARVLPDWPHQEEFASHTAVKFLRDTIHAHPHEITLLTIGPLTNIGTLFRDHPETAPLVKSVVMMGGAFFGNPEIAEWNILCDPEAAAILFNAPVKTIHAAGLDVTLSFYSEREEAFQILSDPALGPVKDMSKEFFERSQKLYYHDIVAAASIFHPDLCKFERGNLHVRLPGGQTEFMPYAEGKHYAAHSVDKDLFFKVLRASYARLAKHK